MLSQAVLLLALAATSVSADVKLVQAVRIIENIKVQSTTTPSNVLLARQDAGECVSSAEDYYESAPTPGPDVSSAVLAQTDDCTWTMDQSVSEDLMEYMTKLAEWAIDTEDDLEKILDDCDDYLRLDTAGLCSPAGTIYFTGSGNATTATVSLETALAEITGGSGGDDDSDDNSDGDDNSNGDGDSAGVRSAGLSGLAAAVGLFGVVFLL